MGWYLGSRCMGSRCMGSWLRSLVKMLRRCVVGATTVSRGSRKYANLSPKEGNKNYYKGKGGKKGGYLTSKGKWVRDISKLDFLKVPDLTGCQLKPYVSSTVEPVYNPGPDSEEFHRKKEEKERIRSYMRINAMRTAKKKQEGSSPSVNQ
uniref:Uncharacterized protein n=1 Tax=Mucochytrium quahogii TaxID=96639 RepID=A0A7S2SNC1_9STRA|mmetsp:Transcript_8952/g.19359  ORF Transcript_8952/g.19359 Transcript_8952/m.19359 type:complete len:150 (+) Transcript_8952:3-452(+)